MVQETELVVQAAWATGGVAPSEPPGAAVEANVPRHPTLVVVRCPWLVAT
jgi:hypothetical protein